MGWDKVWERTFKSQEWGKYPNEELFRFIARNFYTVGVLALVDLRWVF